MDLTLDKSTTEKMEPEKTDFNYGQRFTHSPSACEFECIGYRMQADGLIYLIGRIPLNEDKAKYEGEYTTDIFPLFECKAHTVVDKSKAFNYPTITLGSKVDCSLTPNINIYTVIGAYAKYNGEVNLQLILANKLDNIWNVPEKFCTPIVEVKP